MDAKVGTRKSFSRRPTARLTIFVYVWAGLEAIFHLSHSQRPALGMGRDSSNEQLRTCRGQGWVLGCSQVNKFEQVWGTPRNL